MPFWLFVAVVYSKVASCFFAAMFGSSVCAFPFFVFLFLFPSCVLLGFTLHENQNQQNTHHIFGLLQQKETATTSTTKQKKTNKKNACVLLGKVVCCSCVGFCCCCCFAWNSHRTLHSFMFWCNMYVWLACFVCFIVYNAEHLRHFALPIVHTTHSTYWLRCVYADRFCNTILILFRR